MELNEMQKNYLQNMVMIKLQSGGVEPQNLPEVVFAESGSYTDGKKIIISAKAETEEELLSYAFNRCYHEAEHILSTPSKTYQWSIKRLSDLLALEIAKNCGEELLDTSDGVKAAHSSYLSSEQGEKIAHSFLNAIEDGRIERIAAGKSKKFATVRNYWRAKELVEYKNPPKEALAAYFNEILTYATCGVNSLAYNSLPEEIRKAVEDTLPNVSRATHGNCKTAVDELFKMVPTIAGFCVRNQQCPPNMQPNPNDKGDYGNRNENGPEEAKPGENADDGLKEMMAGGTGNSDKETQSGNSQSDASGSDAGEDATENLKNLLSSLKEQMENEMQKTASELNPMKKLGKSVPNNDKPMSLKDMKFFDNKVGNCGFIEKKSELKPKTARTDLLLRGNVLRQKSEKFFEKMEMPDLDHLKSGTPDSKDLWKLVVGQPDFYKKKAEDAESNTAIYFLVDNSGSMSSGDKFSRAWSAMTLLEVAYAHLLPIKITAFDEIGKIQHVVVKGWEERYAGGQTKSQAFLDKRDIGSGNYDGYSIRIAANELLQRPENQKILFILSDGLPAYRNGEADTQKAAEEVASKGISVIPIFFGSNYDEADFRKIYGERAIVTSPNGIENAVIDKMKMFLKKM